MFTINNETWDIQFVNPVDYRLYRTDGSLSLAVCDDNDKIIYISNQVDEDKLFKILCHEITHASMFSYNVFLTIEQEEMVADLIATYGTEIIYLAKKLYKQIKREL